MVVVVGVVHAVVAAPDLHAVHVDRRRLDAEAVVHLPDPHVANHERVQSIRAEAVDAFAEVEPVAAVAAGFVVVEADEGQRADVHILERAVWLHDRQRRLEVAAGGRLEAVAVAVVLAGAVAREGVERIGPPEARAVVGVEGENLPGQPLAGIGLHGQIAVQHVVNLGAVLQEEAVADALVADAVAHHQVVGAVDRHPAVAAVPDRSAHDVAAPHRIPAQVEVDAVAAQDVFLAQVAELSVADRPGRSVVIHRVTANALRLGGFDDHVARQVGDGRAVLAGAQVGILQGRIKREAGAVDCLDGADLGGNCDLVLGPLPAAASGATVPFAGGDDDAVADFPAAHRLRERHGGVALFRGGAELEPGAAERGAVQIHAPAAADDGGARVLVLALEILQTNRRRVLGVQRLLGRANLQGGPDFAVRDLRGVGVAVEAVFARQLVAGLDGDQADGQRGALVAGKGEDPGDVDEADRRAVGDVVGHRVTGPDLHPRARAGHLAALPGFRVGPGAAAGGADDGSAGLLRRVAPSPHQAQAKHDNGEDQ